MKCGNLCWHGTLDCGSVAAGLWNQCLELQGWNGEEGGQGCQKLNWWMTSAVCLADALGCVLVVGAVAWVKKSCGESERLLDAAVLVSVLNHEEQSQNYEELRVLNP